MKIFLFLFTFHLFYVTFGQEKKVIAINNFETFFKSSPKSELAGEKGYYIKGYGDLFEGFDYPMELYMMLNYDSTKFYESYEYDLQKKLDTIFRIEELDLSLEIKNLYKIFRQSASDGQNKGTYNTEQDEIYSDSLRTILLDSPKPLLGYFLSAKMIMKRKFWFNKTEIIIIEFNNNLDVIDFSKYHKKMVHCKF